MLINSFSVLKYPFVTNYFKTYWERDSFADYNS